MTDNAGPLGDFGDGDVARRQLAALRGVPRTAIIPLLARHLAGSRPTPILTDPLASSLVHQLGLASVPPDRSFRAVETGTAIRTNLLDEATREFAERHPGATVVTVAAGLCTRYARLANLSVSWLDVDLPEVAALRHTLLPPAGNRSIVAGSALTPDWHDQVDGSHGVLFIVEGLTMYLAEREVRELVIGLATAFPGSELLIETVGPHTRQPSRYAHLSDLAGPDIRFTWGVRDLAELTTWHPGLDLRNIWYVMDYHPSAWPALLRLLRHLPSIRSQSKIGHFGVSPAPA